MGAIVFLLINVITGLAVAEDKAIKEEEAEDNREYYKAKRDASKDVKNDTVDYYRYDFEEYYKEWVDFYSDDTFYTWNDEDGEYIETIKEAYNKDGKLIARATFSNKQQEEEDEEESDVASLDIEDESVDEDEESDEDEEDQEDEQDDEDEEEDDDIEDDDDEEDDSESDKEDQDDVETFDGKTESDVVAEDIEEEQEDDKDIDDYEEYIDGFSDEEKERFFDEAEQLEDEYDIQELKDEIEDARFETEVRNFLEQVEIADQEEDEEPTLVLYNPDSDVFGNLDEDTITFQEDSEDIILYDDEYDDSDAEL